MSSSDITHRWCSHEEKPHAYTTGTPCRMPATKLCMVNVKRLQGERSVGEGLELRAYCDQHAVGRIVQDIEPENRRARRPAYGTKSDLLEGIETIQQLVRKSAPGRNDDGLRRVEEICSRIEHSSLNDHYIQEKVRSLRGHAQTYFSARKHQNWPEGAVQQFVLQDCVKIRMALGPIEGSD